MPKINKVEKSVSSISMTREAWAILHQRAKETGLSKSDYLENLIRRGDVVLYDAVREFLVNHYVEANQDLVVMRSKLESLEAQNEKVRKFLITIGVSPNLIP